MPEAQPAIGRIVRVALDGGTWPAIVLRPPGKRHGIDVTAFTPDGPRVLTDVAQSTSRPAEGTWHWPPRSAAGSTAA